MAIIYSYPYVNTVNNSDTLVISVSDTTANNGFLTKSLTADNLASYVTARVKLNVVAQDTSSTVVYLDTQDLTITGTTNEIETRVPTGQMLQIGLPDNVTIARNLNVTNRLLVFDNEGDGSIIDAQLSMDSNRIINLSDPVNAQDAATKSYVDTAVTGLLDFKGTFRADTGEILSGSSAGSYLYNCPGGAGTRVAVAVGDYYIVSNAGGNFYCSGDLLNVGDSVYGVADAAVDSSTINDWGTVEGDNIEGSGVANTVPLWTDSQVLGNSMLSQDAGATTLTVAGNINGQGVIEGESLTINTGPSTITGELDKDGSKITNLADPTVAQDAATKAYVDAVDLDFTGNSGTGNVQQGSTFDILGSGPITTSASGTTLTINSSAAEGTGTTQTLPVWSDGPAGVLSDSGITQTLNPDTTVNTFQLSTSTSGSPTNYLFGPFGFSSTQFSFKSNGNNGGFYRSGNFRFEENLAVGRTNDPILASLDVGTSTQSIPAAFFRNGVVISNNPSGVQVDNTSMVIGAGNNDNVSGSDHCLIVGSNNQITSNSDQSVAFGQGNAITGSIDAFAVGNSNTLTSSLRTQALGFNNTIQASSSFIAGGDNNISTSNSNIMVLGYDNSLPSGNAASGVYIVGGNNQAFGSGQLKESFGVGNNLTLLQNIMTLGYRNNASGYPATNKNLGLGETKFVVGVGSSTITDANALIITEGGINGGSSGSVPQIPRVILPTIPTFSASNDAAADAIGIPEGALYQNNGVVQVNRGGGSTTDPLAGGATSLNDLTDASTVKGGFNGGNNTENLILGQVASNLPNLDTTSSFGGNVILQPSAFGNPTNLTSGYRNVLITERSGQALTTGNQNIAIGTGALNDSVTGNSSVAIGVNALGLNTKTGTTNNTAVGSGAAVNSTIGEKITSIGAGSGWISFPGTGSNITTIGYQAWASSSSASNEITLGNSSVTALRCAVTSITSLSDERDKKDITDLEYGLDFIESLQPKQFVWDNRTETAVTKDEEGNEVTEEIHSANKGKKDFGFIAQEVQPLDNDVLRLVYDENPDKLEMSYGKLVPILVKAVKELSDKVKALENA